jgi:hypothetical protein
VGRGGGNGRCATHQYICPGHLCAFSDGVRPRKLDIDVDEGRLFALDALRLCPRLCGPLYLELDAHAADAAREQDGRDAADEKAHAEDRERDHARVDHPRFLILGAVGGGFFSLLSVFLVRSDRMTVVGLGLLDRCWTWTWVRSDTSAGIYVHTYTPILGSSNGGWRESVSFVDATPAAAGNVE